MAGETAWARNAMCESAFSIHVAFETADMWRWLLTSDKVTEQLNSLMLILWEQFKFSLQADIGGWKRDSECLTSN
jgi:hypothetical protein